MHLLSQDIEKYISEHTSPQDELLQELERDTHLNVLRPQMLSGQVQGAFLRLFTELFRPKRVLEIGTFTGYSALCLAQGMPEDGELITIDINEELKDRIKYYIDKAGFSDLIQPIIGDAKEVIPELKGTFDLVFIDADKQRYPEYYDLVFNKVHPGGYIVADNVLWYGKIADKDAKDKATKALRQYNDKVQADDRVENVMLSIRDGLLVAKKK